MENRPSPQTLPSTKSCLEIEKVFRLQILNLQMQFTNVVNLVVSWDAWYPKPGNFAYYQNLTQTFQCIDLL